MSLSKWARRLNLHARRCWPAAARLPPLMLITDRHRLRDPLAAAENLPPGSAILLRDYDDPERRVLAAALAALCRRRRLLLIVGGDPLLAAKTGAGGLHLPERLLRHRSRHRRQPTWLLTAAAHGRAALRHAGTTGADACLLSPVFPTASHHGARPLGPWRFAALVRRARLPVYALGGVDRRTARRLLGSGAGGIAAIGAFEQRPAGGAE